MSLLRRILATVKGAGGVSLPSLPTSLGDSNNTHPMWRHLVRDSAGNIYVTTQYLGISYLLKSTDNGFNFTQVASWTVEQIGPTSIAIDGSNIIHIVYESGPQDAEYRTYNTVTDVLSSPENFFSKDPVANTLVVLDSNGIPHVVYRSVRTIKGTSYRYIFYKNRIGGVWSSEEQVDPAEAGHETYHWPGIAIDGADNVHVSFTDYDYQDLWWAKRTGVDTWTREEIDTSIQASYGEPSILVDSSDKPCIAYIKGDLDLWFAKRNGSWSTGEVSAGSFNVPAIASNGGTYYYIVVRNTVTGKIVLFKKENGVWSSEIELEPSGDYPASKWSYNWNPQAGTYIEFIFRKDVAGTPTLWYDRYEI